MRVAERHVVQTRNDFGPVNDYVSHVLDRQKDLLSYRRFMRWSLIIRAISLTLVAAGFSYLLYSFGLYMQQKAKLGIEVIGLSNDHEPKNAAKPTPSKETTFNEQKAPSLEDLIGTTKSASISPTNKPKQVDSTDQSSPNQKDFLEPNKTAVSPSSTSSNVKVDFTVFKTEELWKGTTVVTGYRYSPENIQVPTSEYCYVGVAGTGAKSDIYHAANRITGQPVVWEQGLPDQFLQLAKSHCKFSGS